MVITFLPRSKHLLISWLQPPSAVILEPPKIKIGRASCRERVETVAGLVFWGAPKSLQMVTVAMKLKDAYSLEGKL